MKEKRWQNVMYLLNKKKSKCFTDLSVNSLSLSLSLFVCVCVFAGAGIIKQITCNILDLKAYCFRFKFVFSSEKKNV